MIRIVWIISILVASMFTIEAKSQSVCEGLSSVIETLRQNPSDRQELKFFQLPQASRCKFVFNEYSCFWASGFQVTDRSTLDRAIRNVKGFVGAINSCIKKDALPVSSVDWRRWRSKSRDRRWEIWSEKVFKGEAYNRVRIKVRWGSYIWDDTKRWGIELRVARAHKE